MITDHTDAVTTARRRIAPAGFRPVVYCHSAGGSAAEIAMTTVRRLCTPVTDRGSKIVGHTTGASFGTGGTASGYAASGSVAASLAMSDPGTPSLLGVSMGATTALVYALANPGGVSSIGISAPALDLEHYYENNTNSIRSFIEAAWGITYPAPLPAAARIVTRAAELRGIPIDLYYSPVDIYTTPQYERFAAESGARLISVGNLTHANVPGGTPAGAFLGAVKRGD